MLKVMKSDKGEFMKFVAKNLLFASILLSIAVGCRTTDPAAHFIASMDRAPVEKRPKNWEQTKILMARPVPEAGQLAPDFSLPTLDGAESVTRSAHQEGHPLVLIFGSFT